MVVLRIWEDRACFHCDGEPSLERRKIHGARSAPAMLPLHIACISLRRDSLLEYYCRAFWYCHCQGHSGHWERKLCVLTGMQSNAYNPTSDRASWWALRGLLLEVMSICRAPAPLKFCRW